MKLLIASTAAAAIALTSAPAVGQHARHSGYDRQDNHHDNGWHKGHRAHKAKWNKGYRFGRNYRYTSYNSLPRTYVRQYNLSPRYRYVYNDGYIYQVDPTTYAVTRILQALAR